MIRLIPVAVVSALILTGCATPTGNGPTYSSPAEDQRMQQDTSMNGAMGSGPNAGQGYKGNSAY